MRFGRRVEAKGARPVSWATARAVAEVGSLERSKRAPRAEEEEGLEWPAVLMNRRTAELMLEVEYHFVPPARFCWRSQAAGWIGWRAWPVRTRIGLSSGAYRRRVARDSLARSILEAIVALLAKC